MAAYADPTRSSWPLRERNTKVQPFCITMLSLFDSVEMGGLNNRFQAFTITHEAANNLGSAVQILQSADLDQGNYRNHFSAAPFEVRLLPTPPAGRLRRACKPPSWSEAHGDALTTDRMARIQFPWQRGAALSSSAVMHNGQHDLPWPAGEDSGANHIGAISGWHIRPIWTVAAPANGWWTTAKANCACAWLPTAEWWLVRTQPGATSLPTAATVVQATPNAAPGWAKASTATPTAGPLCARVKAGCSAQLGVAQAPACKAPRWTPSEAVANQAPATGPSL